jgi:hypothetical protein
VRLHHAPPVWPLRPHTPGRLPRAAGLVRLCADVHCTGAHLRSTRSLKMDLERVPLVVCRTGPSNDPNGLLLQPQIQMRFLGSETHRTEGSRGSTHTPEAPDTAAPSAPQGSAAATGQAATAASPARCCGIESDDHVYAGARPPPLLPHLLLKVVLSLFPFSSAHPLGFLFLAARVVADGGSGIILK